MNRIKVPNLPEKRVKAVLISSTAGKEVFDALERRGVEPLVVYPCGKLPEPVSAHPDMLFHQLCENEILYCEGQNEQIVKRLREFGFVCRPVAQPLFAHYPADVLLNAARIGSAVICNKKHTADEIVEHCKKNALHIINVAQGYAKCSVCVVDERAVLTADRGIACRAAECGLDVLQIREGSIRLPGYTFGFIGGCCGKLSKGSMAFCGDVRLHPDYKCIEDFLNRHGVRIDMLSDFPLHDIGTILPLTEE